MNMNVLKDKVIAAFRISDIERKDWDTTVNHEGKLVKVKATKFIAKMLHDQKHSEETGGDDNLGDYAVQRDPAAALTLAFYCWGYKYNGKMVVSQRKPDGNEFGMSFLKPADWTRLLKTAGYNKETKKYPLPVFVKVKLSGTRNYLGEFGGIEMKTAQTAILNEMDDMLTNFETAREEGTDDMPGADGGEDAAEASETASEGENTGETPAAAAADKPNETPAASATPATPTAALIDPSATPTPPAKPAAKPRGKALNTTAQG